MVSAAVAGQVFSAGDIALKQTPSFMPPQHRVNKVLKMSLCFPYGPGHSCSELLTEGNYASKITVYILFHITLRCWYSSPEMSSGMSSKNLKDVLKEIYVSISPSIHPYSYLSSYLLFCLSVNQWIIRSIDHPSIHHSIYLSIYLSINWYIIQSIYLSIYSFIIISIFCYIYSYIYLSRWVNSLSKTICSTFTKNHIILLENMNNPWHILCQCCCIPSILGLKIKSKYLITALASKHNCTSPHYSQFAVLVLWVKNNI